MKSKKQPNPNSVLKLTIEDNTYEVKIPTVGQLIDIENIKSSMGSNFDTRTQSGLYASALNEAIAYFTVLVPQLKEDLTVKSLFDLSLVQSKKIVSVYIKVFKPWWTEWMTIINSDDEVEESEASGN